MLTLIQNQYIVAQSMAVMSKNAPQTDTLKVITAKNSLYSHIFIIQLFLQNDIVSFQSNSKCSGMAQTFESSVMKHRPQQQAIPANVAVTGFPAANLSSSVGLKR